MSESRGESHANFWENVRSLSNERIERLNAANEALSAGSEKSASEGLQWSGLYR